MKKTQKESEQTKQKMKIMSSNETTTNEHCFSSSIFFDFWNILSTLKNFLFIQHCVRVVGREKPKWKMKKKKNLNQIKNWKISSGMKYERIKETKKERKIFLFIISDWKNVLKSFIYSKNQVLIHVFYYYYLKIYQFVNNNNVNHFLSISISLLACFTKQK